MFGWDSFAGRAASRKKDSLQDYSRNTKELLWKKESHGRYSKTDSKNTPPSLAKDVFAQIEAKKLNKKEEEHSSEIQAMTNQPIHSARTNTEEHSGQINIKDFLHCFEDSSQLKALLKPEMVLDLLRKRYTPTIGRSIAVGGSLRDFCQLAQNLTALLKDKTLSKDTLITIQGILNLLPPEAKTPITLTSTEQTNSLVNIIYSPDAFLPLDNEQDREISHLLIENELVEVQNEDDSRNSTPNSSGRSTPFPFLESESSRILQIKEANRQILLEMANESLKHKNINQDITSEINKFIDILKTNQSFYIPDKDLENYINDLLIHLNSLSNLENNTPEQGLEEQVHLRDSTTSETSIKSQTSSNDLDAAFSFGVSSEPERLLLLRKAKKLSKLENVDQDILSHIDVFIKLLDLNQAGEAVVILLKEYLDHFGITDADENEDDSRNSTPNSSGRSTLFPFLESESSEILQLREANIQTLLEMAKQFLQDENKNPDIEKQLDNFICLLEENKPLLIQDGVLESQLNTFTEFLHGISLLLDFEDTTPKQIDEDSDDLIIETENLPGINRNAVSSDEENVNSVTELLENLRTPREVHLSEATTPETSIKTQNSNSSFEQIKKTLSFRPVSPRDDTLDTETTYSEDSFETESYTSDFDSYLSSDDGSSVTSKDSIEEIFDIEETPIQTDLSLVPINSQPSAEEETHANPESVSFDPETNIVTINLSQIGPQTPARADFYTFINEHLKTKATLEVKGKLSLAHLGLLNNLKNLNLTAEKKKVIDRMIFQATYGFDEESLREELFKQTSKLTLAVANLGSIAYIAYKIFQSPAITIATQTIEEGFKTVMNVATLGTSLSQTALNTAATAASTFSSFQLSTSSMALITGAFIITTISVASIIRSLQKTSPNQLSLENEEILDLINNTETTHLKLLEEPSLNTEENNPDEVSFFDEIPEEDKQDQLALWEKSSRNKIRLTLYNPKTDLNSETRSPISNDKTSIDSTKSPFEPVSLPDISDTKIIHTNADRSLIDPETSEQNQKDLINNPFSKTPSVTYSESDDRVPPFELNEEFKSTDSNSNSVSSTFSSRSSSPILIEKSNKNETFSSEPANKKVLSQESLKKTLHADFEDGDNTKTTHLELPEKPSLNTKENNRDKMSFLKTMSEKEKNYWISVLGQSNSNKTTLTPVEEKTHANAETLTLPSPHLTEKSNNHGISPFKQVLSHESLENAPPAAFETADDIESNRPKPYSSISTDLEAGTGLPFVDQTPLVQKATWFPGKYISFTGPIVISCAELALNFFQAKKAEIAPSILTVTDIPTVATNLLTVAAETAKSTIKPLFTIIYKNHKEVLSSNLTYDVQPFIKTALETAQASTTILGLSPALALGGLFAVAALGGLAYYAFQSKKVTEATTPILNPNKKASQHTDFEQIKGNNIHRSPAHYVDVDSSGKPVFKTVVYKKTPESDITMEKKHETMDDLCANEIKKPERKQTANLNWVSDYFFGYTNRLKKEASYSAVNRPDLHEESEISETLKDQLEKLGKDNTLQLKETDPRIQTDHLFSHNSSLNGQSYTNADGKLVELKTAITSPKDRTAFTTQNLAVVKSQATDQSILYTGRPDTLSKAKEQAFFIFSNELNKTKGNLTPSIQEVSVSESYRTPPKKLEDLILNRKGMRFDEKTNTVILDYPVTSLMSDSMLMEMGNRIWQNICPSREFARERMLLANEKASLEKLKKETYTVKDDDGHVFKVQFNPILFSTPLNSFSADKEFYNDGSLSNLINAKAWTDLQPLITEKIEKLAILKDLKSDVLKYHRDILNDHFTTWDPKKRLSPVQEILHRDYIFKLLDLPPVYHCKSSTDRTSIAAIASTALQQWIDLGLNVPERMSDLLAKPEFKELAAKAWTLWHQRSNLSRNRPMLSIGSANPNILELLPDRYLKKREYTAIGSASLLLGKGLLLRSAYIVGQFVMRLLRTGLMFINPSFYASLGATRQYQKDWWTLNRQAWIDAWTPSPIRPELEINEEAVFLEHRDLLTKGKPTSPLKKENAKLA